MGRHAGWTTAASALAAEHEGDAPHILLLPEIAFDEGRFLAKVEEALVKHDQCVIAVSEGLKGSDGEFLSATGTTDSFGHAQLGGVAPLISNLIGGKLGCKCHWAVPDYLLRSARHIASGTDLEQAYAVGRAAVEFAVAGKNAVMLAIRRLSDAPLPMGHHCRAIVRGSQSGEAAARRVLSAPTALASRRRLGAILPR
jgi:ATP-dependent phosphofructokinase / diphosphate-dependent phosphofructokinase